jgi:hypothetical protein
VECKSGFVVASTTVSARDRGNKRQSTRNRDGGIFSYQDVFHDKPYDSLSLIDAQRISSVAQAGEERREGLREG